MKKLCLFIFSLLLIFAAGCELDTSEIDRETELEYITVDTSEAKVIYHINEEFDKTGLKVIGHYSNGTTKEEDLSLADVPPVDTSEENPEVMVTVTLNNKYCTFPIVVQKVLPTSIEIKRRPKFIVYRSGDSINLDGILAVIKYSNGEEGNGFDANDLVCTEKTQLPNGAISSKQLITVFHKDNENLKGQFYVYVQNGSVTGLQFMENSEKTVRTTYMANQEIDVSGIKLSYIIEGNTNSIDDIDNCYRDPFYINDLPSGEHEITFNVNDYERKFKINIVEGYVVGAALETENTVFYEGETIDFKSSDYTFIEKLSNGDINERTDENFYNSLAYSYNGGEKKSISEPLTIEGTGIKTIIFYYTFNNSELNTEDKTDTFEWKYDISVWDSKLDSISACFKPDNGKKVPLEKTPNLDFENKYGHWEITGKLLKGEIGISPESCTYEFIKNESDDSSAKTVKVKYHDIRQNRDLYTTASMNYTYPIITRVKLNKFPTKKAYFVGDNLNLDGLQVTLYYSDCTTATVDKNYVISNSLVENMIVEGTNNVNLFFTDITSTADANAIYVTIPVEILKEKIDHIEILPKSNYTDTLKFRKGETYDFLNYFEVKSFTNKNDTSGTLINSPENLQFKLVSDSGDKGTLYVIYTNSNKTYSASYAGADNNIITLLEPSPESIVMVPSENCITLDEYIYNSSYTVHYKDGTNNTFNDLSKLHDASFGYTEGNGTLTINYTTTEKDILNEVINFTSSIEVAKRFNCVTSISIVPKDQTKTYSRGSIPQKSDFTVTANYNSGSTKVLDDSEYILTCDEKYTDALTDSEMIVIAKYKDLSPQNCTVNVRKNITGLKVLDNNNNEISSPYSVNKINNNEEDNSVLNRVRNSFTYKIVAKNNYNIDVDNNLPNGKNLSDYEIASEFSEKQSDGSYILSFKLGSRVLKRITITIM